MHACLAYYSGAGQHDESVSESGGFNLVTLRGSHLRLPGKIYAYGLPMPG